MSLFSALSVSLSGLQATQAQLQLTANNVSNAGQEGYTRKSVILTTASLGDIGGGVQVSGFQRATDKALFTTLTTATSNAALRAKQDTYLQQVQNILGTDSSDDPALSQAMTSFVNSWTQMASEPESIVNQRQVIQDANNLAEEIQRAAEAVEELDRQCFNEVNTTLSDLNSYLDQVKDLNQKISQSINSKQSAGDLEDARDRLVLKISEITGITVLERNFGQIAIYSATGYQLVDGSSSRSFSYDGTDITSSANPGLSLNTALSGGSLEGLVSFRMTSTPVSTDPSANVIQKLRSQLDSIAGSLLSTVTTATSGAATFASAYNAATTSAGNLASDFFQGTDRTSITVNAALLDGSATVKTLSASPIADILLDSTRSFSADGLSLSRTNYASLVTSVLTTFQQASSNIATLSATADTQRDYLQEKLTNQTNVNVDTEMVQLISLQQSYAASARVMATVQNMFQKLESLV